MSKTSPIAATRVVSITLNLENYKRYGSAVHPDGSIRIITYSWVLELYSGTGFISARDVFTDEIWDVRQSSIGLIRNRYFKPDELDMFKMLYPEVKIYE